MEFIKQHVIVIVRTSIGPALGVKRHPLKQTTYNSNPPKKSLLDSVDDDPQWSVTCHVILCPCEL